MVSLDYCIESLHRTVPQRSSSICFSKTAQNISCYKSHGEHDIPVSWGSHYTRCQMHHALYFSQLCANSFHRNTLHLPLNFLMATTLSIKIMEWTWEIHGHGAVFVQWRTLHDFVATVFSWVNQLTDSLSVRYPETHTGKVKKLSGSVFYCVIQKKFLWV